MKSIKSYTSIWNVEKVLYAVGDLDMIIPATYTQIAWAVGAWFLVLIFSDLPPLCLIDNWLFQWICIPVGTAWFMSQKTFDGKRPYQFLKSVLFYLIRPKRTYAGKKVVCQKKKIDEAITIVRRELYVPD